MRFLDDPVFKLHELWNHSTLDPGVNAVRPTVPLAQSAHQPRYIVKIAVAFVRSRRCDLGHLCPRADWDHRLYDPIVGTSSWNRGSKYRSPAADYFGDPCFNRRARGFDRTARDTDPSTLHPPSDIGRGRGIDHRPHQCRRAGVGCRENGQSYRRGQVIERTEPNIEVRIGAILALERIAQKNLDVHIQIMEILCEYLQNNCFWVPNAGLQTYENLPVDSSILPRADIQRAVKVLGTKSPEQMRLEDNKK